MLPGMTATPGLKLLLIVPHPDDEVYGAAGTLMEYIAAGESCGLVTLTRGERLGAPWACATAPTN